MTYTVGEIAEKLNIAPSALRYYDKEGLLPFVERSSGGIRIFREEDMDWLELIECMKRTGMPIKEIKHFIDCCVEGDSRINDRLSIIKNQRDRVLAEIEHLQARLSMLEFKNPGSMKKHNVEALAAFMKQQPLMISHLSIINISNASGAPIKKPPKMVNHLKNYKAV